jgi:GT2 family glycosyltransferase
MPYLSHSDYLTQNDWVHKYYREASSMTFNLNVFRTADLQALGFVNESFTGYYNDIALMLDMKAKGLKVVLINGGNVTHLGMATTSANSKARAAEDRETFRKLFPQAALPGHWAIREEVLAAGRINKLWLYVQSRASTRIRKVMVALSRLALQLGRFWQSIRHS